MNPTITLEDIIQILVETLQSTKQDSIHGYFQHNQEKYRLIFERIKPTEGVKTMDGKQHWESRRGTLSRNFKEQIIHSLANDDYTWTGKKSLRIYVQEGNLETEANVHEVEISW